MKYIIAAYDKNRAIGSKGGIPWLGKMKTDMQFVRQRTTGNAIIMGRKTFDSIGHALSGRQNIVITHRPFVAADVTVVSDVDAAYAAVEDGRDAYIFGGGQIYALALDTVDEILATEIDTEIEGADAYFPQLSSKWQEVSREHHPANPANPANPASIDNIYPFDFVTYRKKV